ncbi:porin family protein [Muriicola sp. Z0-33]|uniref:porin family protein n=1 Tax=Muriicola sp. Z0-33 TaxID=2816957 RepID=UPI0022377802|nr:porin family protein [Muriicola sp. Z0-33]MCW5517506.1 outer membrane beta-barrel protein [Muriicola sp. Z0-33]
MKKLMFLGLLMSLIFSANAQDADFGVKGGYLNVRASIKADDISISASESGFYLGVLAVLKFSDKFHLQPELLYARVSEADAIFLPVIGKIYLTDKLNLQVGPQLVFSTQEVPDDFTGTEFDLAGGLGIDITSVIFTEVRYTVQINNSYTGQEDIKVRGNYLTLGVGFRF